MTTHPSITEGASQCVKILDRLQRTPGEWVPMVALARIARGYAVHSRISDLRARGHIIDHHNLRHGKKIHSYYRLADSSPT
jgi:hypothetical protein